MSEDLLTCKSTELEKIFKPSFVTPRTPPANRALSTSTCDKDCHLSRLTPYVSCSSLQPESRSKQGDSGSLRTDSTLDHSNGGSSQLESRSGHGDNGGQGLGSRVGKYDSTESRHQGDDNSLQLRSRRFQNDDVSLPSESRFSQLEPELKLSPEDGTSLHPGSRLSQSGGGNLQPESRLHIREGRRSHQEEPAMGPESNNQQGRLTLSAEAVGNLQAELLMCGILIQCKWASQRVDSNPSLHRGASVL